MYEGRLSSRLYGFNTKEVRRWKFICPVERLLQDSCPTPRAFNSLEQFGSTFGIHPASNSLLHHAKARRNRYEQVSYRLCLAGYQRSGFDTRLLDKSSVEVSHINLTTRCLVHEASSSVPRNRMGYKSVILSQIQHLTIQVGVLNTRSLSSE